MWPWPAKSRSTQPPTRRPQAVETPAVSTLPKVEVRSAEQLVPFQQYLELQGLQNPMVVPRTQEEVEGDDELVARLLVHFRKNRPGPSSLPAISLQIVNAVADEKTSLSELSRLISQDPAMSAGVLKVANSPTYRGTAEIETLRDAVTRLGLNEVGRVAGMVAARSLFQSQMRAEFAEFGSKWSELFAESLVSARLSVWLAMRLQGIRSDHAFLAALLHDLGRSVGLRSIAALSQLGPKIDAFDPRIDRVLERVHVEIGGEVHQHWSLPRFPMLVTMVHHDLNLPTTGEYREVHVVRLCSAMVQLGRQPWRIGAARAEIDESCRALRVDGYELRSLDTQIRSELQAVAQLVDKPKLRPAGASGIRTG
jgi:HD-like signal output (HDOD) protein